MDSKKDDETFHEKLAKNLKFLGNDHYTRSEQLGGKYERIELLFCYARTLLLARSFYYVVKHNEYVAGDFVLDMPSDEKITKIVLDAVDSKDDDMSYITRVVEKQAVEKFLSGVSDEDRVVVTDLMIENLDESKTLLEILSEVPPRFKEIVLNVVFHER